jgi:hypothetical protein
MKNVLQLSSAKIKYLILSVIISSSLIFAQTGKLSGQITDAVTGEPLIGANVIVEGTTMGAASDLEGYYSILNLRPGTYSVRFQYIGYNTQIVTDIKISADKTTTQDIQLTSAVIESETVVITADKPIVEFNQTSSVKTLSSEEIQSLPVQNLDDIINLQAGIVKSGDDFHVRGGRVGEVQFQVEGVSMNNPFTNEASLTIDRSIIGRFQL